MKIWNEKITSEISNTKTYYPKKLVKLAKYLMQHFCRSSNRNREMHIETRKKIPLNSVTITDLLSPSSMIYFIPVDVIFL